MGPLDATIHVALAFDIGYEIDLTRAGTLLPGASGGLVRRRRTPESIQYRPAPLRVALEPEGIALPGGPATAQPPRAELSLFDFGAISLVIQFPVRMTPDALLALASSLADPSLMIASARRLLAPWIERLRPAVIGFEVSEISEEYVIFQMGDARADWLEAKKEWIAGLVRLEAEPLSAAEVLEATRLSLSYTPNDLVT